MTGVTNVVLAGLGGQGVLTAADILALTAFRAGLDVKKAEVHGMSQRGGSVTSDVRFGTNVLSPMVSAGQADYLVVIEETQIEPARHYLAPDGRLVACTGLDPARLSNRKAFNVAMLGMLSAWLDFDAALWVATLKEQLAPALHAANLEAFTLGRETQQQEIVHAT